MAYRRIRAAEERRTKEIQPPLCVVHHQHVGLRKLRWGPKEELVHNSKLGRTLVLLSLCLNRLYDCLCNQYTKLYPQSSMSHCLKLKMSTVAFALPTLLNGLYRIFLQSALQVCLCKKQLGSLEIVKLSCCYTSTSVTFVLMLSFWTFFSV